MSKTKLEASTTPAIPSSSSHIPSSFIPNFSETGKLDGMNYPIWKVKIRSHLVAWKLWRHTTGADPKPEDVLDTKGRLLEPVDADELAAWEDCDAQALAMLIGTTADAVIPHIQMAETSVEAWAVLKDLYKTDNT